MSAAKAPTNVPGFKLLNDIGQAAYTGIYRQKVEWPLADLILAVSASNAIQRIHELEQRIDEEGASVTSPAGGFKSHPLFGTIEGLQTRVRNSLRDCRLRASDGIATKPHKETAPAAEGKSSKKFDLNEFLQ